MLSVYPGIKRGIVLSVYPGIKRGIVHLFLLLATLRGLELVSPLQALWCEVRDDLLHLSNDIPSPTQPYPPHPLFATFSMQQYGFELTSYPPTSFPDTQGLPEQSLPLSSAVSSLQCDRVCSYIG